MSYDENNVAPITIYQFVTNCEKDGVPSITWNFINKSTTCLGNLSKSNKYEILRFVRCKNREKICTKKKNHIRQYLRSSVICLRLQSCRDFTIHKEKKNTRCDSIVFFLKNNIKPNQIQLEFTKPNTF